MRIQRLIVKETAPTEKIIRDITFCLYGANFIVDKTSEDERETGNSIGKSTVAKIIDLCLSAKSASSLYTDAETKNKDENIENYIVNNKLEAILEFISEDNQKIVLTSSLYPRGSRTINGEKYLEKDYLLKLNEYFFEQKETSPTFKQLISKFVRINSNVDEKIFKFLTFAPNSVYESIYSFLFKLAANDIVALKASLEIELANYKKITDSFKRTKQLQSIELLEQKLLAVENELINYRNKRENFQYIEEYQKELENNRNLKAKASNLEQKIDSCSVEIDLIKNAISEQKSANCNISIDRLKQLYEEAGALVDVISKTFEELVTFHNKMVNNKVAYLEKRKVDKEKELLELKKDYNALIEEKKKITIEVLDNGLLSEYNILNKRIEELSIEKGEIENSLAIWKENTTNIKRVQSLLDDLNSKTNESIIDGNTAIFNEYFTKYSSILYTDSCVIAFNKDNDGSFPVRLGNIGGIGSGKKKGLISAFDLAYYSFAERVGIVCPRFIVHDKMETTDKKQLKAIFNIAEEIRAQLIVPILSEKLDFLSEKDKKKHVILELSNNDKFFKVK